MKRLNLTLTSGNSLTVILSHLVCYEDDTSSLARNASTHIGLSNGHRYFVRETSAQIDNMIESLSLSGS